MEQMPGMNQMRPQKPADSQSKSPVIFAKPLGNELDKKGKTLRRRNLRDLHKQVRGINDLAAHLGSTPYVGPAIDSLKYALLRESFDLSVDAFSGCIYYPELDGWIQPIPLPPGFSTPTVKFALRNDSIISSSGNVRGQLDGADLIPIAHADEVDALKPGDTKTGRMWFFGASPGVHKLRLQFVIPGTKEVTVVVPPGIPERVTLPVVAAEIEQPYIAGDRQSVGEGIAKALGIAIERDENGVVTGAQAVDRWGVRRVFSLSKVDLDNGAAVTLTYSEFKSDGTPGDLANSKGEILKIISRTTAEVFTVQTAQARDGYEWAIHRETDIYGITNYMHTSITYRNSQLDMNLAVSPQSNPLKNTSFTGKFVWQPFGDPTLVSSAGTPLHLSTYFGKEVSQLSFFATVLDEEKSVSDFVSRPLPQYETGIPLETQYALKVEMALMSAYACSLAGGITAGLLGFGVCAFGVVITFGTDYLLKKWSSSPPKAIPRMIPSPSSSPNPVVPQPTPSNGQDPQNVPKPPKWEPPPLVCAPDEVPIFGNCQPLTSFPDWTPDY